jgi:5-methylcytosine-specific restriction endonuclease McrA
MTELQRQILEKRESGMSHSAIAKALGCSRYAVYYACNLSRAPRQARLRNRRRRRAISDELKAGFGSKCAVCGYARCPEALEFDHIFPKDKVRHISKLSSLREAKLEAAKCLLLCCRCHRERHAGLLDIGAYMEPST